MYRRRCGCHLKGLGAGATATGVGAGITADGLRRWYGSGHRRNRGDRRSRGDGAVTATGAALVRRGIGTGTCAQVQVQPRPVPARPQPGAGGRGCSLGAGAGATATGSGSSDLDGIEARILALERLRAVRPDATCPPVFSPISNAWRASMADANQRVGSSESACESQGAQPLRKRLEPAAEAEAAVGERRDVGRDTRRPRSDGQAASASAIMPTCATSARRSSSGAN